MILKQFNKAIRLINKKSRLTNNRLSKSNNFLVGFTKIKSFVLFYNYSLRNWPFGSFKQQNIQPGWNIIQVYFDIIGLNI